jgi:hypothetical protein
VPEDLVALWWVAADDNSVVPAGTFTAFGFGGNYLTIIPARLSLVDTVAVVQGRIRRSL